MSHAHNYHYQLMGSGHAGCGCPACACGTPMVSPYELAVASGDPTAQAFVGGATPVRLSLEYVVDDGASSPSIKVTTVDDGSTATWEETAPTTGYQVKNDFLNLHPGARITLDATEAAARLRWCETFCC